MNWKEFLKPDLKKIILTIAIFLVIPAPLDTPRICDLGVDGAGCDSIVSITFFGVSKALSFLKYNYTSNFEQNSLIYVFLFIVSYLISCLIVFAYNKYKK